MKGKWKGNTNRKIRFKKKDIQNLTAWICGGWMGSYAFQYHNYFFLYIIFFENKEKMIKLLNFNSLMRGKKKILISTNQIYRRDKIS